jgi:carboxypeptidase C (cathepsin A)
MRFKLLFGWLFLALAPQAWCQAPTLPAPPAKPADTAAKEVSIELTPSVTKHTVTLNGVPLAYTATAAQIPIRNETGEVECRMFYVAYTKDGASPDQRPVTFAFNGGPGSATLWLHMGALGPKRAPMNDDGSLPRPPYTAVANAETWLDFTDVVCIDAPATGYSRIVKRELNSKFFGVREDIRAFTEFVRGWLKEHKRWRSPVFIAGESYGGIRGSGLCTSLFDEGVAVSGFVSISGTSNFLTLESMRGNDAAYIGFLPSMAACAWYHNKVSHAKYKAVGDLVMEAKQWTDTVYGPALQLGDSLTAAQKDKIAEKLSFYLGISKKYCLGSNLKVSEFAFFRELLRDDGLTIGRYDGRLVGKDESKEGFEYLGDPSDEAVNAPFISSINDYLDRDLAVKTDLAYLAGGNVYPWKEQEGSYSETASELSRLLLRNPNFRVLYCCGYYDLACPLNATHFTVNHMGLDPATRSHINFAYYPAGHMMYIEKSSRKKLHDDVSSFVASTLSGSK